VKKLVAAFVLAASTLTLVQPARAGSSSDAALALGAFAVFNQLVRGETIFHGRPQVVRQTVVVVQQPPAVVYASPWPPVVYAPPPPPVVVYPSESWVLQRGYWVWVPSHHFHKRFKHHDKHHHEHDD
jgi:hypothetical protein